MKTRLTAAPALFLLKCLLFLSGAAGLAYEVVWARWFADLVGSTALAMTTVFATFMICLALGARFASGCEVLGRPALTLYGMLQIGIAVSAMVASVMLRQGSGWVAGLRPSGLGLAMAYDVAVAGLFIGVPVMLMGATLPVVVNAAKALAPPSEIVARLYGWNTIGAACGTLAAGFILIWKLGLWGTLLAAATANLLAGFAALAMARHLATLATDVPAAPPPTAPLPARWPVLIGLSGFTVLAAEVLWGRMAKFLLGDRTLATAALLAIFIAALGTGALLAAPLRRRWGGTTAATTRLVAGLLMAASFLHLAMVPLAAGAIEGNNEWTRFTTFWAGPFASRIITIWLLIFPPAVAMGVVFPLILAETAPPDAAPGRTIGRLYLVNSLAAALGAFAAAFTLSRWLGTMGSFLALALLLTTVAAILLWLPPRSWPSRTAGAVALAAALLLATIFPRHLVWLRADETLVAAHEDEYGVQVLAATRAGTWRVRNNRLHLIYELGHPATSHAQQMAAHLTVLLAHRPETVLNIGTGYGITAGAYILYPEVRSLETVEILPFLVAQQHRFAAHNFDYLADPRARLVTGDGRHFLAAADRRYDIISVNVLDPYLPGSSSLYTIEFWQLARSRLNDGGVYTQLFWGMDIPLLVKGLREVFPTVLFFPAYGGSSYNLVAFKEALSEEQVRMHYERLGPRAAAALGAITGEDPRLHLSAQLPAAWEHRRRLLAQADREPGRLHRDAFPVLEFRWAHRDAGVSILDSPMVRE